MDLNHRPDIIRSSRYFTAHICRLCQPTVIRGWFSRTASNGRLTIVALALPVTWASRLHSHPTTCSEWRANNQNLALL